MNRLALILRLKSAAVGAGLLFALFAEVTRADANGLAFHFDFSKSDGQSVLTDATGRVTAQINRGSFVIQHGGLRIATGAQVLIPADQLPPMTNELTVCAWVMKGYFAGTHPILFKGEHPSPLQFIFSVGGSLPAFVYKNEPGQPRWKGIYLQGASSAAEQPYAQTNWVVVGASPQVKTGYWTHLAAVFKQGEIDIFVNGQRAVSASSAKPEMLKPNDLPLYIGAERLKGQSINYNTGNILVNDLRLYENALSSQAIQSIYEAERPGYPRTSLIAEGALEMPPCLDYWRAEFPGYDPRFERKLELTKEFEKSLPDDSFRNQIPSPGVKTNNGRLVFQIHGKLEYPIQFVSRLVKDNRYLMTEALGAASDFSAAGLSLMSPGDLPPDFWLEEGQYDWSKVDEICRKLVATNPRTYLALRLFLRPPKWWFGRFREEMEVSQLANGQAVTCYSNGPLASARWLQDSTRMVRDLVAHVEASEYANHVYAYTAEGGAAGEWYWPAAFDGGWPGYSPTTRRSFQQWLRAKYGDDLSRLRHAWHRADMTFEQAEVPSPTERQASECSLFRELEQARPVLDFRDYMSDITLTNITETCRAIKEACAGRKLVIVYSGYPMLFAGKGLTLHKSGLQRTRGVFDSKFVDCMATPIDYVNRRGGETGLNINAFNGTARLNRKLIWQENDLRTHFHAGLDFGRTTDLAESLSVIERGFGWAVTQGAGIWWFPLEDNAWFHEETMMRRIATIKQAADHSLTADCSPNAEVALIFDEDSLGRVAANSSAFGFLDQHLWGTYQNAARMGAPFDVYLLSDLANRQMPKYKLYIFLNAYHADSAAREAIRKCLGKRNAVAVWCYAPGFLSDQGKDGFDVPSMEALTGIRLTMQKEEKTLTLTVTDPHSPITRFARPFKPYTFGPVFAVEDPAARILGMAGGKPALAVRELKDWRSIYTLMPLTQELLQGMCDYAGVHVYSRSFDVFSANHSYIMLHTTTDGSKTVTLPTTATVREVLTRDLVGKDTPKFTEKLPAQTTRIYRIER